MGLRASVGDYLATLMEGTPKLGKHTHTQMRVSEPSATLASCGEDFLAGDTLSQGFCGCLWAPRSPEGTQTSSAALQGGCVPARCLSAQSRGSTPSQHEWWGQGGQAGASAGVGVGMEHNSAINNSGTSSSRDGRGGHCAPSKRSQTEKDKSCVISLTPGA